jgi:hypothetical protein
LLGPQETGFNHIWTTHVICGSVLELNKERENTNEKDISQTKKRSNATHHPLVLFLSSQI